MAKRPGAPGRDSPTRDHIEAARQLRFDEKTLAELRDLPADDVHGMLRTLRAALRSDNMQRVHAIFRAWDMNASLASGWPSSTGARRARVWLLPAAGRAAPL